VSGERSKQVWLPECAVPRLPCRPSFLVWADDLTSSCAHLQQPLSTNRSGSDAEICGTCSDPAKAWQVRRASATDTGHSIALVSACRGPKLRQDGKLRLIRQERAPRAHLPVVSLQNVRTSSSLPRSLPLFTQIYKHAPRQSFAHHTPSPVLL
jgi:hypothetical protein